MNASLKLDTQAVLGSHLSRDHYSRDERLQWRRTQYSDHPYLQCWTLLCALTVIVVIEITVIIYADGRNEAVQPKEIPYIGDPVLDLRENMGLDIGNDTSPGAIAFLKPDDNVTYDIFTEQYTEMCQSYFMPRGVDSEQKFRELFGRFTDPRSTTSIKYGVHGDVHSKNIGNNKTVMLSQSNNYTSTIDGNYNISHLFELETSIPLCPCVPETLIGAVKISFDVPHLGDMELNHPDIRSGHWAPPDCLARHRTAIIIPFRDREQHLQILLNYLHPLLQRQMLYYTVFVVEQVYPDVFNKASIMNVGFREAMLADSFDCFIFHDVDMIPENDHNFYTCTPQPRHVGSHCDKFSYEVAYASLFGGATAFTGEQFMTVNGFSNDFYGWGGEDDDMYQRVRANNMSVSRYPGSIARYTMIKHGSDTGNPYNKRASVGLSSRPVHYRHSGLNSLRYYVRRKEFRPLYTWMAVELPDRILTKIYPDSESAAYSTHHVENVTALFYLINLMFITLLVCS